MSDAAFQDQLDGNHCWGCGPDVPTGLKLKSYWSSEEQTNTICDWQPRPEFAAGPRHIMYGGTIGSIIDCHGIWTAIANAYRIAERPIGTGRMLWYATASLQITYRKPVPLAEPLTLRAWVTESSERKALVSCTLTSAGEERATGELVAVLVNPEWFQE